MVLGFSAVLAVVGAAFAVFARDARRALVSAGAAALGAAGACFAMGSVFVALALAALLAIAVPAVALAAAQVSPPPSPDVRPGAARLAAASLVVVIVFAGLGWLLTSAPWPAATGTRDQAAAWLGWRLLTDHILLPAVCGLLLGAAALVASSAIGPRVRRPRAPAGETGGAS